MINKKTFGVIIVFLLIFLDFTICMTASADEAGVGVLNVPPKFGIIQIVQQEENIRVYLTISDYNSWEDLFAVNITLGDVDTKISSFVFKQYKDTTSFEKIYEFSESSTGSNLLIEEKCSYTFSTKKDTVDEKCNIELLFVFHTTWFSKIK